MEFRKRLIMTFKDIADKRVSISVDDPRADIKEAEIKSAMGLILSKNIFAPGGNEFATLVEAKVVQTNTEEFDLVL